MPLDTVTPISPVIIIPAIADPIEQRADEIEALLRAADLRGLGCVIDIPALAKATAFAETIYRKPIIIRRTNAVPDEAQRELDNYHDNLSDDQVGQMLDEEGQS